MIEFHKDGNEMAIVTDEDAEASFFEAAARALASMIDDKKFDGDWEFQLAAWLPQLTDIAAKLRGYKSDVIEKRLIQSGNISANALLVRLTDRGELEVPQTGKKRKKASAS